jgi:hypothetical protein
LAEVTVFEAAQCLGISPDTVRRRIGNGALKARKAVNGQNFTWRVELPDDVVASCLRTQETPDSTREHSLEESVQALLDSQAALISTLQAQVQAQLQQLEAKDKQIQELHVLLREARELPAPGAGRPWWRRLWGRG